MPWREEDRHPVMNVFDPERGSGGGGVGDVEAAVPVLTRILNILAKRFERDLAKNRPHMVALIIGQPDEPLVKEQILPKLDFWHHRSGNYIDLFCVGFSPKAAFDAAGFNLTLRTLEANTKWRYSGGTDLILVNVRYWADTKEVTPDFTSALAVTLEQVVRVEGYERLSIFFEKVMSAAKASCGIESPAEVSDALGASLMKSAFKGLISSLVPDGMKAEAKAAFLFAVQDISKDR